MDKDILKKIILENQQRIPGLEIVNRDYSPDPAGNYIFTGQRRAGKTYFIYSLIRKMLNEGESAEKVLYINFEDERLIGFDLSSLDIILESYSELFGHQPVLFFDEIQNIPGWQKFARRVADQGYKCYITGSNAEMLSGEMASTLGGRYMILEIEPLSFTEFLQFHGIIPDEKFEYSPSRFEMIRLFDQYFSSGGLPELIRFADKKEYLSNLFQKVLLGDIIARKQVRNPHALKILVKKLAESTKDEVSYTRMRNIISSAGMPVGVSTIIEYISYIEESFLVKPVNNLLAKISSRESKKKYYFRDNGILSLFLADPASFQLETLIFNALRRIFGEQVYYLRNGFEVDFIVPGEMMIQVCHSLTDAATRKREISGMVSAARRNQVKYHFIVTYSSEERITLEDLEIEVVPAWKWLLKHKG